jgi:hypothetical protein
MSNSIIMKNFLTNTDETGRFIVYSKRTGKRYFVEPIMHSKTPSWGSVDPATGKMMHKKGDGKYTGAIKESESLITEKNGFKNIKNLEPGISPLLYIDLLDSKYPSI